MSKQQSIVPLVCSFIRRIHQTTSSSSSPSLSPAVLVRVLANGLDPKKITPTGPKNNILKGDVLRYLEGGRKDQQYKSPSSISSKDAIEKFTIILNEMNLKGINEFIGNINGEMRERLLVTALCHAVNKTIHQSETFCQLIEDKRNMFMSITRPYFAINKTTNSPYLIINFNCKQSTSTAVPLLITVHRRDDKESYFMDIEISDPTFDFEEFSKLFYRVITEPLLMLL